MLFGIHVTADIKTLCSPIGAILARRTGVHVNGNTWFEHNSAGDDGGEKKHILT